jgi:hypothetical protein
MTPFCPPFWGRKPRSVRSGEALPLPLSSLGDSIDGAVDDIRGRVDDVVV